MSSEPVDKKLAEGVGNISIEISHMVVEMYLIYGRSYIFRFFGHNDHNKWVTLCQVADGATMLTLMVMCKLIITIDQWRLNYNIDAS